MFLSCLVCAQGVSLCNEQEFPNHVDVGLVEGECLQSEGHESYHLFGESLS